MDDDDEFDGDIADEELMLAFNQASGSLEPPGPRQAIPTSQAQVIDVDDLPSDTFDSSPERSTAPRGRLPPSTTIVRATQRLGAQTYKQRTLFGQTVQDAEPTPTQATSSKVYRVDKAPEPPTHHKLNTDALRTWVYPTNLGAIRDYQYTIVKNGLFNNTLVALPTGLGKTFIAATIMLNYYRWTKDAKIVFVAPTKPLAAQQVDACLNIAGIAKSQTTLLTGEVKPVVRESEWEDKRVLFMTPQTLQNDLSKGYADPKKIVLLVVDEAHRAKGDYAYVKVVEFLRRFQQSFRVLALTATPGSSVEAVQEVIDSLGISHVEIRTEESIDIQKYVHQRSIDTVTLDPSDEMLEVRDLFSKALKPITDKLSSANIYYGRDPMSITVYGLMKAKADWLQGPGRHVHQGVKFVTIAVFTILQGLAHSIKLLNYHGIIPFYHNIAEFRSSVEEKGEKGSKHKRQILNDPNFQKMMRSVENWMKVDGFVSHPKISYLCDTLLNHFMDAGEGSGTRAIVFSEYRDSAEEIVRTLNLHKPLLSASVFVGQADSKRSEGMKQKDQIQTMERFKKGLFNVLVATSIGEEGLDIGQVDLIICYDASASPIRMLQRMGRTGRKRAGNIVLLLMKGKEEQKFAEAKDSYASMQKMIADGTRFSFRHDMSHRIVPRDMKPEVEKRHIDIPVENTQTDGLPEPKGRKGAKPSKKKFHMPDGVETGFTTAASISGMFKNAPKRKKAPQPVETDFLAEVPALDKVLLTQPQMVQLDKLYRDLPFSASPLEEVDMPSLVDHPAAQRALQPVFHVQHGRYTKRCVKLFRKLARVQLEPDRWIQPFGEADTSRYRNIPVKPFATAPASERGQGTPEDSPAANHKRQYESIILEEESEAESQPKRRKQNQNKKPRAKAAPARKRQQPLLSPDPFDDDPGPEEAEPHEPLPRATKEGKKKRPKGKRQKTARNLEEMGDDCMRTSDNYESEGSDSGGDLVDFVVEDEDVTSSMLRPQGSTSPTTMSPISTVPRRDKPVVSSRIFSTQDSDDDMPALDELLGTSASKSRAAIQKFSPDATKPAARKKGRAVVDDSDSDE